MSKQSLAVKYRPKTFSDLCEQQAIVDILENQIKTKEFQRAYLFTGPAGCGKTTSARILSNMINNNQGNPIEIDAASNNGVENIRNIIQDSKRKPLDCKYKIFVLDEAHALTNESWQALLKLLEEPPTYSIFILCTTNPEKIPNTILSRVQRFQFNKISTKGIIERLTYILNQENISNYDIKAVEYVAEMANGGMREAISLMDKCLAYSTLTLDNVSEVLGIVNEKVYGELMKMLSNKDKHCIEIIDKAFEDGKDLKVFMTEFAKYIIKVNKSILLENKNIPNLDTITKLVFNILSVIKYDNNPYVMINLMLLNYCGGKK